MPDNGFEMTIRKIALLAVTLLALAPASALAAAGDLDRSFSGNGRLAIQAVDDQVSRSIEASRLQPIAMASAPGPESELVAANNRRVLRYRANGRPQTQFGGNGRAAIPTAAGMTFQLAGLAVDSRGRVLVAGTTEPPAAAGSGSRQARVSVYRFLANGRLDRNFGEGGVTGAALGPMEATGLTVDSRDRAVLTGFAALTPSFCNTTPVFLNTTTVARLTPGGALDPSFGSGGTFTDALEDPQLPTANGNGVVYVNRTEPRCGGFVGFGAGEAPVASVLGPGGNLLRRFPLSPDGSYEFLETASLAVDARNRIVVLLTRSNAEGGGNFHQQVRRLLPDGSPDPDFGVNYGEAGVVSSPGPPGTRLGALTTDGRNRVILAGSAPRQEGRGFVVVRLNAAGRLQTWFGDEGATKAGFGRRATAMASQVYRDSRGRLVLAGTVVAPWLSTGHGLAFARFLSGGR